MPACSRPDWPVLCTCATQLPLTLAFYNIKMSIDLDKMKFVEQPGWLQGVLPVVHPDGTYLCDFYFDVTAFNTHPLDDRESDLNFPEAGTRVPFEESLLRADLLPRVLKRFLGRPLEYMGASLESEWGLAVWELDDGCLGAALLIGHQQDRLPILLGGRLRDLFVIHHLMHLALDDNPCPSLVQTRIRQKNTSAVLEGEKTLASLFLSFYFDLHTDEAFEDPIEIAVLKECLLYGLRAGFLHYQHIKDAIRGLPASSSVLAVFERGLDAALYELVKDRSA